MLWKRSHSIDPDECMEILHRDWLKVTPRLAMRMAENGCERKCRGHSRLSTTFCPFALRFSIRVGFLARDKELTANKAVRFASLESLFASFHVSLEPCIRKFAFSKEFPAVWIEWLFVSAARAGTARRRVRRTRTRWATRTRTPGTTRSCPSARSSDKRSPSLSELVKWKVPRTAWPAGRSLKKDETEMTAEILLQAPCPYESCLPPERFSSKRARYSRSTI